MTTTSTTCVAAQLVRDGNHDSAAQMLEKVALGEVVDLITYHTRGIGRARTEKQRRRRPSVHGRGGRTSDRDQSLPDRLTRPEK